jgi:phosphatidylglycerol:prolipoprotein diacylglycerol transferase
MQLASLAYPAVDPVALRIGPVAVHWYGLAYLVAFVSAALIARSLVRRWRIAVSDDDLMTMLLAAVIGVVTGGRLGYTLFYGAGHYLSDPLSVFAIWDGGMSFHGGLIGILIAGFVISRKYRMPVLTLWDLGAVGAPVGFLTGRLANFVNGELWGRVTDVPWAMVFPAAGPLPRHPSQLYEALLEGVVLLTVMWVLSRRRPPRPRGELVGWLLALYGVFRIAVEFYREPDVQLGFIAGEWLTMGMVLSLPMVAAGISLLVWSRSRRLPQGGRGSL